jgi:hypothetical protein
MAKKVQVIQRCLLMTTDPGDLVLDLLVVVVQQLMLLNNWESVKSLKLFALSFSLKNIPSNSRNSSTYNRCPT